MRSRRRLLATGVTTLTLALSGCIGEDNNTDSTPGRDPNQEFLSIYRLLWDDVQDAFDNVERGFNYTESEDYHNAGIQFSMAEDDYSHAEQHVGELESLLDEARINEHQLETAIQNLDRGQDSVRVLAEKMEKVNEGTIPPSDVVGVGGLKEDYYDGRWEIRAPEIVAQQLFIELPDNNSSANQTWNNSS